LSYSRTVYTTRQGFTMCAVMYTCIELSKNLNKYIEGNLLSHYSEASIVGDTCIYK